MAADRELTNRLMLRARDAMDRDDRSDLDASALARISCVSPAHFIRTFKATFEAPSTCSGSKSPAKSISGSCDG